MERTLQHFYKLIGGKLTQLGAPSPREAGDRRTERDGSLIPKPRIFRCGGTPMLCRRARNCLARLNYCCRAGGRGYKGIPYFSNPSFPWKTEP